jgi:hypothetical protein
MRNICGASPAEVAKKVASKLLVKNIYSMYFSIVEIKTNYHKNGKLVKYRIIVKKMGKQVGGEYRLNLEDPNDPIFTFFSKEMYDISFEEKEHYGRIIHIKDLSEKNCLQIIFHSSDVSGNDYIELFKLNRCQFQGSANLETLIKYAKHLKNILKINLDKICLDDASIIPDTKILLWLLSILTTGESWYNKFGFTSDDYHNELRNNNEKINMNIMDFIILCIEKCKKIIDITKSLSQEIMLFFGKYNKSKSVKDVFIKIKRELNQNSIPEDFCIIGKILEIIYLSSIIQYNPYLNYIIPEE